MSMNLMLLRLIDIYSVKTNMSIRCICYWFEKESGDEMVN